MPLSSTAKGIVFSLTSLTLLGMMPVISNLRPAAIEALPFALALSVWQIVFAFPVFAIGLSGPNKGIFGVRLPRRELWRTAIVGIVTGILFGLSTYLYVLGVEKAGAANAAIAMQAYPLMAIAIEMTFLKQKKNALELKLTLIMILALYYLGTSGTWSMSGLSPWFLLTLCVPLLWAVAHVAIRLELGRTPVTPAQVTFFRVVISTLTLSAILLALDPFRFGALSLEAVLQPFSVLMGLVYYAELIAWFYAIRHIEVSFASTVTTPWPALTMVLAFFLLGDAIAPYQIGALVVVIASIYGLTLAGLRKDRTHKAA
jgi:drug/metabolite transporter (DMT)-like permease